LGKKYIGLLIVTDDNFEPVSPVIFDYPKKSITENLILVLYFV